MQITRHHVGYTMDNYCSPNSSYDLSSVRMQWDLE